MMFTYGGPHAFESSIMVASPDGSNISTLIPAKPTAGYEAAHGNALSQFLLVYIAELGVSGTQVNELQIYTPATKSFQVVVVPPGNVGPASPSPDGTSYSTSVSPLAVPSEGRIWAVDLATGATTQLTPDDGFPYDDSFPTWSPDGQWIAFLRLDFSQAPDYHINVYRVRPDGSGLTCLTPGDEFINAATYAPDGRLVFSGRNGIELFDPTTMQRTTVLPLTAWPSWLRSNGEGIGWSRTLNIIVLPMINRSLNRYEMWSLKPDGSDFHMLFSNDQSIIANVSFIGR